MASNGFYLGGFAEGLRGAEEMTNQRQALRLDKRRLDIAEQQGKEQADIQRQQVVQKWADLVANNADSTIKEVKSRIEQLVKAGKTAEAEQYKVQAAQTVGRSIDAYSKRLEMRGGVSLPSVENSILSYPITSLTDVAKAEGEAKVAGLGPMAEATGQTVQGVAAAQGLAPKPLEQIGAEAEAGRAPLSRVAAEADITAAAGAKYRAPPEVMQIADALGYPEGSEERRQFLLGATQQNQPGAAREAEVADMMASFGVDRPTAIKIRDGLIKVTQPDQFGNVSLIDTVTGQSVSTINPEQDRLKRGATEAADQVSQTPTSKPYEELAEKSVGGRSQAGRIITGAGAAIGLGGEVEPERQAAQRAVARVNSQLRALLIPEGKPSNWEQQNADRLLADPTSAFTSPESARRNGEELRVFLQQMRDHYFAAQFNPNVSSDQRAKNADAVQRYSQSLTLLGQPAEGGGDGGVPYVRNKDEYDRLPKGARYRGIDPETRLWHEFVKGGAK